MKSEQVSRLRNLLATVVLAIGVWQVALPWFQPLSTATLVSAAMGAVYLIIALGLYGTSRFALLLAAGVAIAHAITLEMLGTTSSPQHRWLVTADCIMAITALIVVWHLRHQQSA